MQIKGKKSNVTQTETLRPQVQSEPKICCRTYLTLVSPRASLTSQTARLHEVDPNCENKIKAPSVLQTNTSGMDGNAPLYPAISQNKACGQHSKPKRYDSLQKPTCPVYVPVAPWIQVGGDGFPPFRAGRLNCKLFKGCSSLFFGLYSSLRVFYVVAMQ